MSTPPGAALRAGEGPLHALFEAEPLEPLGSDAVLFWSGDPAEHVFVVVAGVLRLVRMMADGRRTVIGFRHPGDLIAAGLPPWYPHTAEGVTTAGLRRLPQAAFESAVAESAAGHRHFLALLRRELAHGEDRIELLARKRADERLASFLLSLASRAGTGPQDAIELPMSRRDIADYLGLTTETVSRGLTGLVRDGVIALCDRHSFCIRKRPLLLDAAGDIT